MSNTITISKNQFQELNTRIMHLERMIGLLVEKLGEGIGMTDEEAAQLYKETYVYEAGEPEYGTDAWWEWATKQGEEDVTAGRVTTLTTKEDINTFFDTL